jgi:hypothetical protein
VSLGLDNQCARRKDGYEARRPEHTVLYKLVQESWQTFLQQTEAEGRGLPGFVAEEFEAYLTCGIHAAGCLELECVDCGRTMVVAYSCKKRGFCPSCLGRRMNELAAHLTDNVLPAVPIRPWVFTVPAAVRYLIAYDRVLCGLVFSTFIRSVFRFLRRKAKAELGLASLSLANPGSVTIIQRFGSSANLHPHTHSLLLDGVFVLADDGSASFCELSSPTDDELAEILAQASERIDGILSGRGLLDVDGDLAAGPLADEPILAACTAASLANIDALGNNAGQPSQRLVGLTRIPHGGNGRVVEHEGYSLFVGNQIDGRDRRRLERIVRYNARPPIAQSRLRQNDDGSVIYRMKSPWQDGTTAITMDPLAFIARLCALIPPPRFHMVRYHGCLAPHSKLRSLVVPRAQGADNTDIEDDLLEGQLSLLPLPLIDHAPSKSQSRYSWAQLLKRVFKIDIENCPHCQGHLRIRRAVHGSAELRPLLERQGLPTEPPRQHPPRAPPQLELDDLSEPPDSLSAALP